MNASVGMERNYYISQFNTMRFSSYISDIPAELMLNDEFLSKLRLYQFLDSECSFAKYIELYEMLDRIDQEQALEIIENQKVQTLKELIELIKGE